MTKPLARPGVVSMFLEPPNGIEPLTYSLRVVIHTDCGEPWKPARYRWPGVAVLGGPERSSAINEIPVPIMVPGDQSHIGRVVALQLTRQESAELGVETVHPIDRRTVGG